MALAHRAKVKDPAKAFISTWRTSTVYTGSTADNQIKLPLEIAGTYKFTVQWGDGTSNLITTWDQAETTHTYPAPGDYTVTITGFIKGWDWGGGDIVLPTTGDMRKLLTITQFGCLRFATYVYPGLPPLPYHGAFFGCENLTLTAVTDMPNFKGCTSTHGFLWGCYAVTTINNINKWDVSKIDFFRNTFRNMPYFDDNVGNWNMSNATHVYGMFYGNGVALIPNHSIFNNGGSDSIKNWDVSNVTNFSAMFFNQPEFNQEIGTWNVGNATNFYYMLGINSWATGDYGKFNNGGSDSIKNWNTSNVTNMSVMFYDQIEFNQEIGTWDTSNVNNMYYMFGIYNTDGIFNNAGSDSIRTWNTSNLINMQQLFYRQASFNQYINTENVTINGNNYTAWDTSNATTMRSMFINNYAFNQPIDKWNVSLVNDATSFMYGKTFNDYSAANYDALLIAWASRPVQPNINIDFAAIKRTLASDAAKAILTSAPNNWTISDGGLI